ncbi:GTPase [Planktothrix mougeotii]|uniref:50S ribosome-binding GTPase n=1 Tax=Planktothrix mougeotii LEGE 06226 TaxID=1828728 RepID=A0ABR9UBF8_9CYAN|nr:GTPase [Planktothrix mougeotii]MBE9143788.1 50S ribosome-binding GTPase [Planktothrix mougeotii LEGE 06226]
MDTKERVRIAVAGHTNTGKTTLIRTLMRTVVGEVRDSSNVTQEGQAYDYSFF